jgi:hypothetical protein
MPSVRKVLTRLARHSLEGALGIVNAYPTRMTDRRRLARLIETLQPIAGGRELVRLGPMGDGGYLVPDDLEGIQACFSPGVDRQSGFEKDCADRGMAVFLADGSVEGPAVQHSSFQFSKRHVGAVSDADFMTLDQWVAASLPGTDADLLLQMDIEGYEYEALLSASEALMSRFRIIVVEFHRLDLLWSKPFFELAGRAFEKTLCTHACVHIHPNNSRGSRTRHALAIPPVMEFTFLRRDRLESTSYADQFPHPLDVDNTANPPLPLPKCWYGGHLNRNPEPHAVADERGRGLPQA